jgi:hypothetical protein
VIGVGSASCDDVVSATDPTVSLQADALPWVSFHSVKSALSVFASVLLIWLFLATAIAVPEAASAGTGSLLGRTVPTLPVGFRADTSDPWGHKQGEQDAEQFAAYYNPDLITAAELQEVGFLDAYSEFASGKTHRESDYITISLVRVSNRSAAAALTTKFQQDLTIGLTPAPRGGTVRKLAISGIPGSEAYLSWFEGSAALDAVFVRGDVVADIERTSPSKAVATQFQSFARKLYARMKVGTTSVA